MAQVLFKTNLISNLVRYDHDHQQAHPKGPEEKPWNLYTTKKAMTSLVAAVKKLSTEQQRHNNLVMNCFSEEKYTDDGVDG